MTKTRNKDAPCRAGKETITFVYETLCSPVNYGGLTLKNRIIFAPTSMGLPRQELLERMRAIAAGGCAMIIVGDVPVLPHGFGPSLYSRKGAEFYRQLVETVHGEGCKICAQLHQSDSDLKGMLRYVPGVLTGRISQAELRPLLNAQVGPYITRLPEAKIKKITEAFGTAAERAVALGFDMVQVHGDRMCGSFSSTVFNHRTDAYGGSAENRALTTKPICGVGGLTDPDFVEAQLADGRIHCAAMSRQLIADPAWPEKVRTGQADTIHRCVRCNKECLGGMMAHRGVHCIYEKTERKEHS